MRFTDRLDGAAQPFQGDRVVRSLALPAGARVVRAVATVAPAPSADPFLERIALGAGAPAAAWGATVVRDAAGRWLEVDFHERRTLAGLTGTGLANAALQVDLGGGAYLELNANGAVRSPNDPPFLLAGNDASLPALTVRKLKVTGAAGASGVDVTEVRVRSVPTNASLRIGDLPPVWTHAGELTAAESTGDLTTVLQAYVDTRAATEHGTLVLPLTLHSDTIARLQLDLDVEYQLTVGVLPDGLAEATVEYDHSTLPARDTTGTSGDVASDASTLVMARLPADARVLADATELRVRGTFEETRIARGPIGDVVPDATRSVRVTSTIMHAAYLPPAPATSVVAVDLLLRPSTHTATLQANLRADADGKPGDDPLFTTPVELHVEQNADPTVPSWVSATLQRPFHVDAERGLWLVVQSVVGEVDWLAVDTSAEPVVPGRPPMQSSDNGGRSWRDPGPMRALSRLRTRPERFEVPILLQIGDQPPLSLDRYRALGRVDFRLGGSDVAAAFDAHLAATSHACVEGEHLANGAFTDWLVLGDALGTGVDVSQSDLPAAPIALASSADGRWTYVVCGDGRVYTIDGACGHVASDTIALPVPVAFPDGGPTAALVVSPDGARGYAVLVTTVSQTFVLALQALDLDARTALGPVVMLGEARSTAYAALSPDGATLYVAGASRVLALDVGHTSPEVLARQAAGRLVLPNIDLGAPPAALAVVPTTGAVLVATHRVTNELAPLVEPRLHVVDPATRRAVRATALSAAAWHIAPTPDGTRALVVAPAEPGAPNAILLVDVATLRATALAGGAVDAVVAPDGRRGFVATAAAAIISTPITSSSSPVVRVIDLARGRFADEVVDATGVAASALVVGPQGDRLVAIVDARSPAGQTMRVVRTVPIGRRVPAEWAAVSGTVALACRSDASGLAAMLGDAPVPNTPASAAQAVLAQVVPIAAGCPYQFAFDGGARPDASAAAEVRWRADDGSDVRVDTLPIAPAWTDERAPSLTRHARALRAPEGATQAEVRFLVTDDRAMVAAVSLSATAERLANGAFETAIGADDGAWQVTPASRRGVVLSTSGGGLSLASVGPDAAELSQRSDVAGGAAYEVAYRGRTTLRDGAATATTAVPRLELRFLDGTGAAIGAPLGSTLAADDLPERRLAGTAPSDARRIELRLVVPPRSALAVERVTLRTPPTIAVPVRFLAHAPGALTVTDRPIVYDRVPGRPPLIRGTGLAAPTPADDGDCCACCGAEHEADAAGTPVATTAGRPAQLVGCRTCGTEVLRYGGPATLDAPRLDLPRLTVSLRAAPLGTAAPPPSSRVALVDVTGIGEKRLHALLDLGIDDVAHLAVAPPAQIKGAFRNISLAGAEEIVARARALAARGG